MGVTLPALRLPLEALGYEITGELPVFGMFDRGAVGKDEALLTRASEMGRRFAASMLLDSNGSPGTGAHG